MERIHKFDFSDTKNLKIWIIQTSMYLSKYERRSNLNYNSIIIQKIKKKRSSVNHIF